MIINPAITPIVVELSITPSALYASSLNGGHEVLISGFGFPLNKNDMTFDLCGQTCMINRISNI